MRCPHCAAQVPGEAKFCGICGRPIDAGYDSQRHDLPPDWRPSSAMRATEPMGSMSLFELPVARGARVARIAAVLVLDLILAGAGIAMILSYLSDRREAAALTEAPAAEAPAPVAEVEALAPAPVVDTVPEEEANAKEAVRRRPRRRSEPDTAAESGTGTGTGTGTGDDGLIEPEEGEAEQVAFSAALVRRVVDRHATQLQRCYQRAAKQASLSEPLRGRVDIQFAIMPNGFAKDVEPVANTTGSDSLANCVAGLIESWQFPSPGAEEIAFVWPFVFRPPQ